MTVVTNACYNAALVLILTYDLVSLEIYKIKWKVYHNVGLSYARPEKKKKGCKRGNVRNLYQL